MFMSYKYLPLEMASVWVIFLSMISLITLFDFGLSPAIVRNVSYVISGAQNLVKRGIDDIIIKDVISYPLLSRLLFDIKRIYLYLSLIAFFHYSHWWSLVLLLYITSGYKNRSCIFLGFILKCVNYKSYLLILRSCLNWFG